MTLPSLVHQNNTKKQGNHAEELAVSYLIQQHYIIIERNKHYRYAELDVIAWDQDILCFIEIRSTSSMQHGGPLATISEHKKSQIIRATKHYLSEHPTQAFIRFDVLGLLIATSHIEYELVKGAFVSPQ